MRSSFDLWLVFLCTFDMHIVITKPSNQNKKNWNRNQLSGPEMTGTGNEIGTGCSPGPETGPGSGPKTFSEGGGHRLCYQELSGLAGGVQLLVTLYSYNIFMCYKFKEAPQRHHGVF